MQTSLPAKRQILFVGGGHSHALALRMAAMQPMPSARLLLISDVSLAPYSGMIPGCLAGYYTEEEAHIDLRRLAAWAGAEFIDARAVGLDLANRRVELHDGRKLEGDLLSLNLGSIPGTGSVPGAGEFATPVKPIPRLLAWWRRLMESVRAGSMSNPRIVIVGGGAAGIELAFCIQSQIPGVAITVVQRAAEVLESHNRRVQMLARAELAKRGITVLTSTSVAEVHANCVKTAGGAEIAADHILWAAGGSPAAWVRESGLALDETGFVLTHQTLQSVSHPFVFASGDLASISGHPRPKSGVYAVRMAAPLVNNLRRLMAGQEMRNYRPQRDFLSLISTGDGRAIASRQGLAMHSAFWWRIKDRIDRKFMEKFSRIPYISTTRKLRGLAAKKSVEAQRCLGCGGKLPSRVLHQVLNRLREEFPQELVHHAENGIVISLANPDDASIITPPPASKLVQSVDFLSALVTDPHVFGRIAATHAASDLYAMGAEPHSMLAAAVLPVAAESVCGSMLHELMHGVLVALREMQAVLLGGHVAEGATLGLGLTVNGWIADNAPWQKSRLAPRQALILTKPLGVGVLFAAHMQLAAKGIWIAGAIDSMLQSNAAATRIFRRHGVTGCTDVTGFGLGGHLMEMLSNSQCSAEISLDCLPMLRGAQDALDQGVRSSLHEANYAQLRGGMDIATKQKSEEQLAILADPQTSGGLLAGIPADRAEACLADLHAAGYVAAASIGRVYGQSVPGQLLRLI